MLSRWRLLVGPGLIVLLAACATVPGTGRQQVLLVSDQQLAQAADGAWARYQAWAQRRGAFLARYESAEAARLLDTVERVAGRIVGASGLGRQHRWSVAVVKADTPNASVMPNGRIIVHTGLVPVARTEAGLAAVLGHEVAHVVARHGGERMSQQLLLELGLALADAALEGSRHALGISVALGLGAQYGVLLPFSREHELEADRLGLILMARAGFDPREALGVWERMEGASGSGSWEYLSTHPSPTTRRAEIRARLPEALRVYEASRRRAG